MSLKEPGRAGGTKRGSAEDGSGRKGTRQTERSEAQMRIGGRGEEGQNGRGEEGQQGGGRTEAKLKVAQVVVGIHKARVQLDGPSDYW